MDNIYEALKGLIKSIINLFVAIVSFFTGLIDGLAFILGKIRPKASFLNQNFHEKKEVSRSDEELVRQIRSELQEKVTSQEKYYYHHARLEDNGNGFYAVVLTVIVFVLAVCAMLYQARPSIEMGILVVAFMVVVGMAVCIAVDKHQKKNLRNYIAKIILEEEFKDIEWGRSIQSWKSSEKKMLWRRRDE